MKELTDSGRGPKLSFTEGRDEIQRLVNTLAASPPPEQPTLLGIDAPAGIGKTGALIRTVVPLALEGRQEYVFQSRYNLLKETADHMKEFCVKQGPDVPPLIVLKGRGHFCRHRKRNTEHRMYGPSESEVCDRCGDKPTCGYHEQWAEAKECLIVLATHHQANEVCRRLSPTGWLWFDEPPELLEIVKFTWEDLVSQSAGAFFPEAVSDQVRKDFELYYETRKPAAEALVDLVERQFGSMGEARYTQYCAGKPLRKVLGKIATSQTLTYDSSSGRFPAASHGSRIKPGLHARRDFDELQGSLSRLLADEEDLKKGVVAFYKDPCGGTGLKLVRPSRILPRNYSCVILGAGLSELAPYYEFLNPGRKVVVERIEVCGSGHVSDIRYNSTAFLKKYSRGRHKRRRTLRANLLRILPDIVFWACRNRKVKVIVGLLCPMAYEEDIKSGACRAILRLFADMDITLVVIDHLGNTDGLDTHGKVDVFLRFGQVVPNLGFEQMIDAYTRDIPETPGQCYSAANQQFHEIQDYGRARADSRTSDTPLLVISVGRYKEGRSVKGSSPELLSTYYKVLAHLGLIFFESCSVPILEELHREIENVEITGMPLCWDQDSPSVNSGMPLYWSNKLPGFARSSLSVLYNSLNNKVASRNTFNRKMADRHLNKTARELGAVTRTNSKNRTLTSGETVFVLSGDQELDLNQAQTKALFA